MAREFGDALNGAAGGGAAGATSGKSDGTSADAALTDGERERIRRERIRKLAHNLEQKLDFYARHPAFDGQTGGGGGGSGTIDVNPELQRAAMAAFEARIVAEAEDLKMESYGVELLHSIGYTYSLKARQWVGKEESFLGLGKWWQDVKEKGHIISETVGTIRSAVELQVGVLVCARACCAS